MKIAEVPLGNSPGILIHGIFLEFLVCVYCAVLNMSANQLWKFVISTAHAQKLHKPSTLDSV